MVSILTSLDSMCYNWLSLFCLSLQSITKCTKLTALDITKNRLEYLPTDFAHLKALSDLHLSENCIENLPEDFGDMTALTLVKLDLNHLVLLPDSIGRWERDSLLQSFTIM